MATKAPPQAPQAAAAEVTPEAVAPPRHGAPEGRR